MSLRDDGTAALEWLAEYLEGVRERPVLSRVEPGAIRAALPEMLKFIEPMFSEATSGL